MGSTTPTITTAVSSTTTFPGPDLPYWQINIPPSLHEPQCPVFLQNLSLKDQSILATPSENYHTLTWPECRTLVQTNNLESFQRQPLALRKYLHFIHLLKKKYGSIMTFILAERLGWKETEDGEGNMKLKAAGREMFEEESDWKILWNDWPYGIDERIVHLVIWTKFELKDDEETGLLRGDVREVIEGFVGRVFGDCGDDNVIWFKNWSSLKSVRGVEHFHVMLFDPDPEFVRQITNGDIPLSRRVENL